MGYGPKGSDMTEHTSMQFYLRNVSKDDACFIFLLQVCFVSSGKLSLLYLPDIVHQ